MKAVTVVHVPLELSKQITLRVEMEYVQFKSLIYLDRAGTPEDLGVYWVTYKPWMVDIGSLVNNRTAVLRVTNCTV